MPNLAWQIGYKCRTCHAKKKIAITKRHACHANSRGDHGIKRRIKRAARANPMPKAPHLIRKVEVDAAKHYAYFAK